MKISLVNKNANDNAALSRKVTSEVEFTPEIICQSPWSPMLVSDSYLKGSNFLSTQLLVFDIDNKPSDTYLSLNEAIERFKAYDVVIATTRSHQVSKYGLPPVDKYRIIFKFDKVITNPEQYKQNYVYYSNALFNSGTVDEAVKDLARFYYSCKEVKHVSSGIIIKVCDLQIENKLTPLSISSTSNSSTDKRPLSKTSTLILARLIPITEWHNQTMKLMTDMKDKGWSEDEVRLRVAELGSEEWDANDEKRLKSVFKNKEVFFKDHDHMPIEGFYKFVLKCISIMSKDDEQNIILVNKETKERESAKLNAILSCVPKDERENYRKSIHLCKFEYNPTSKSLISFRNDLEYYNKYIPPKWLSETFYNNEEFYSTVKEVPELINRFLKHLVADDEASYNYILDWLSTMLTSRNLTVLTLIGNPGVGKGSLADIASNLVGSSNFDKTRANIFKGRFNGKLADKQLVLLDELEIKNNEEYSLFKDVVNEQISIEKKGVDEVLITNYANFIMASNNRDAIKIPESDRRFSLVDLTTISLPTVFSSAEINQLKTDEQLTADFANYLLGREVKNLMFKPFVAINKKNEITDATISNWEDYFLNEYLQDNLNKTKSIKEVSEELQSDTGLRHRIGRRKFEKLCLSYPQYVKLIRKDNIRYLKIIGSPESKDLYLYELVQ